MRKSFLVCGVAAVWLAPVGLRAQVLPTGDRIVWAWGTASAWHVQYVDSIRGDSAVRIGAVVVDGELLLTPDGCDRDPYTRPCVFQVIDRGGTVRIPSRIVGGRGGSAVYLGMGTARLAADRSGDWQVPDSQPVSRLDPHWVLQTLSGLVPLRWPDHLLAVGDTWSFQWVSVRLARARVIDSVQAVARLDSIVEREGHRSAWISVAGHNPGWIDYLGQMIFDAHVVATVEWDLNAGHPTKAIVHRLGTAKRASGKSKGKQYLFDETSRATITASPLSGVATP